MTQKLSTYRSHVQVTSPVLHEGSQVDQHSILQQWGINPSTTSTLDLIQNRLYTFVLVGGKGPWISDLAIALYFGSVLGTIPTDPSPPPPPPPPGPPAHNTHSGSVLGPYITHRPPLWVSVGSHYPETPHSPGSVLATPRPTDPCMVGEPQPTMSEYLVPTEPPVLLETPGPPPPPPPHSGSWVSAGDPQTT